MQACSSAAASSCSSPGSWFESPDAALMSAMLLSSSERAPDSSAKSRYSRSLCHTFTRYATDIHLAFSVSSGPLQVDKLAGRGVALWQFYP